MRSELRVRIWGVLIGVTSAAEYCAALDARLEALLAKSKPFELFEAIFLGCTTNVYGQLGLENAGLNILLDDSVFQ